MRGLLDLLRFSDRRSGVEGKQMERRGTRY